jgi:hypothetical protein
MLVCRVPGVLDRVIGRPSSGVSAQLRQAFPRKRAALPRIGCLLRAMMVLVAEYAALGSPGAGRLLREFLAVGAGQRQGQWVRLR